MLATWAAALVTFFKGTQALRDIFELAVTQYYAHEESADQDAMNEIEQKRMALVSAMKQVGITDAERRTLRRMLIDLHKL